MYKRKFLDKVIFRINFEPIEITSLKSFSSDIKKEFPNQTTKKVYEGELSINILSGDSKQSTKESKAWKFDNKNKHLTISNKFLILEYEAEHYKKEEFFGDIELTVSPFLANFNLKSIVKTGLRYINRISIKEVEPLKWDKYINKKLLGNLSFAKSKDLTIARSMSHLVVKYEGFDLIFNFGIWNSDYPNEVARKEFILDLDFQSKLPVSAKEFDALKFAKICDKEAERIFGSSIRDGLKKLMDKQQP